MPKLTHARSLPVAAVFSPLEGAGRAEIVAKRLSDAIVLGVLPNGERLPSESALAKQLGVATVTAREALETLRRAGLVRTTRGRGGGSFVTYRAGAHDRMLDERLREISRVELRDAAVHYTAIAAMAAELATERATDDDVENLRSLVEGIDSSREDTARRGQASFSLEMAALSQSARLVHEELKLQAEIGALLWMFLREQDYRDRSAVTQRKIVSAMGALDHDLARRLTVRHIESAIEWLIDTKVGLDAEDAQ
ncbi:MAG TPA: GntR family transcriptional regulator [Glaciibacter sp.]|nr:GntR family transcriptional regulator [Glaciibacter sp.]